MLCLAFVMFVRDMAQEGEFRFHHKEHVIKTPKPLKHLLCFSLDVLIQRYMEKHDIETFVNSEWKMKIPAFCTFC